MAKVKIADLSTINGAVASGDLLVLVDVSDTADSAEGTTKKVTSANLLGAGINATLGTLAVGAITSSGALALGSNTITSGLINGQTISSAANFTGTLGVTGVITAVGNTTGGIKINDASGNQGATIHFLGSSTTPNWQVGNQVQSSNAFTVTPSTTNGGTTFTTPALTIIGTTSAAQFAGTLGVTGLLTVDANIKFPATQVASANANTLDDYEEGTWTPTATSEVNATGITWSFGKYTKIGNKVTLSCEFNLTVTSSNLLTYIALSGIPFVPSSTQNGISVLNNNIRCGFSQITTSILYAFYPVPSAVVAGAEVGAISISYLT